MKNSTILSPTKVCTRTWRVILWREWQKLGKVITALITAYVLLFMVMPLDSNGALLLFAVIFAGQNLAITLGGGDVFEGSERYCFVLPLRRVDYFWSRYLAGLSLLVVLTGVSYVMNAFDLHRHFWALFCESGLADERRGDYPKYDLGNYILCGIFAFSNSYCLAASSRSQGLLTLSWLVGCLLTYAAPALLINIISEMLEVDAEPYLTGVVYVAISFVISLFVLLRCSLGYIGKSSSSISN